MRKVSVVHYLPIFAAVLALPLQLRSQSVALSPSERSAWVSSVLEVRVNWFDDHTPVDPCSVLKATSDTTFFDRMDWRVRHLFLRNGDADAACTRLALQSDLRHIELLSVGWDGADRVVRLFDHGRAGSMLQEYRAAPQRTWTVLISEPVSMSDKGVRAPPSRPPH